MRTYRVIPSPTAAPLWSIKIEGDLPSWSPTGTFGRFRHRADARRRALEHVKADEINNIEARYISRPEGGKS